MEIMTRKQAMALGHSQYFTGKACKHQHTTYRYTSSGACSACVTAAALSNRAKFTPADGREQRNLAKAQLELIRVRAYAEDMPTVRGTAIALAQARFPAVEISDVAPNSKPTDADGGTALYQLKVHHDDIPLVRGVAQNLLNARGPNIALVRQQILAAVEAAGRAQVPAVPFYSPMHA